MTAPIATGNGARLVAGSHFHQTNRPADYCSAISLNAPVTVRVEERVQPRRCCPTWGILALPQFQKSSCKAISRMHWSAVPNMVVGCPEIGGVPVGQS